MNVDEFLTHYSLNAPQIMWFLGAGTSRSAKMPSASDIIWDLKRIYYCTKENQDITDNELNNEAVRNKIQAYLNDLGCPEPGAEDEYAYYFKFVLGDNPKQHQKYLHEKLNPDLISLNSGHRTLAALMEMKKTKVVFTTNFDSVIETAYATITSKELHGYNLEGSYAALDALHNEHFPIYAKMHGDFRYCEMKNLPEQLQENDKQIEKCFIKACSMYGLVVSGYSGRDKNVMDAFEKAIEQEDAFPKGLFWFTSFHGWVFPAVKTLIEKAQAKGINAHIVEVETFDVLLTRIWKVLPDKPQELNAKIRGEGYAIPKIGKYVGTDFPVIRTNAFPILEMPKKALSLELNRPLSSSEFKEKFTGVKSAAIFSKQEKVLVWGVDDEISKIFNSSEIKNRTEVSLEGFLDDSNSLTRAFLIRALARGLVRGKPLKLMKRHGLYYAVISSRHEDYSQIEVKLKKGLETFDFKSKTMQAPQSLAGKVPGLDDVYWMEAIEINLDYFDGKYWLVLRPEIWIEPSLRRKEARDFLTNKKRNRYNQTQNTALEAWKEILLGSDQEISIRPFDNDVQNNPSFLISTTTAFTQRVKR